MKPYLFTTVVVAIALGGYSSVSAQDYWEPTGSLTRIQVVADCGATGGDIAIAAGHLNTIFWCPPIANAVNARSRDAGHFYYVHEYGHFALNTSHEPSVDCWAAQQLSSSRDGEYFINAWINYWSNYGVFHPDYGTVQQRIDNVVSCFGN